MRRVSSRQRITSEESFEASMFSDGEDSYELETEEESLKRRRILRFAPGEVVETSRTVAPSCNARRAEEERQESVIHVLSDDVVLHILGFCDATTVRDAMQTSHRYRDLLVSSDASQLWRQTAARKWKWLPRYDIVDAFNLPFAVTREPQTLLSSNMPLLLSLAAENTPSGIDETLLAPYSRSLRHFRTFRPLTGLKELECVTTVNGQTAYRFTGRVGEGDRCIRADCPLPRPRRLYQQQVESLEDILERFASASERHIEWIPFVSPFVSCDSGSPRVNVTPRLISYFEVSILKPVTTTEATAFGPHNSPFVLRFGTECTAIGLASSSFSLHTRMPGWDRCSFGYHGDDGGIFHHTGHMLKEYGPCFGSGDVIGCGLDYVERAIFYTLNGKFLGYAFTNLSVSKLEEDWYPVVGMDTKCSIQCNFGQSRFVFRLEQMLEQHRSIARSTILGI